VIQLTVPTLLALVCADALTGADNTVLLLFCDHCRTLHAKQDCVMQLKQSTTYYRWYVIQTTVLQSVMTSQFCNGCALQRLCSVLAAQHVIYFYMQCALCSQSCLLRTQLHCDLLEHTRYPASCMTLSAVIATYLVELRHCCCAA
jgi:hypothetical protein